MTASVVLRRQAMTEDSSRSTSSIAFGMSDGSPQISSHAGRSVSSRRMVLPIRPVVVSWPAKSSSYTIAFSGSRLVVSIGKPAARLKRI